VRQQQALPIILMTGLFATTSDRAHATLAGADTLLAAPFELKQVDHEISRILQAQESSVHAAVCANSALFAVSAYEP
jgi:DNA-binding response OmpR family regulator